MDGMLHPLILLAAVLPWLGYLCYTDCRYRRLPNAWTLTMWAGSLVFRLAAGGTAEAADGLAASVACALFLLVPFMTNSVGGGDLKMLAAAGALLGIRQSVMMLFFTSLAGLVLFAVMLGTRHVSTARLKHGLNCLFNWKYDRKRGAEGLPAKQDERCRVPFAPAIAAGTVAALIASASHLAEALPVF